MTTPALDVGAENCVTGLAASPSGGVQATANGHITPIGTAIIKGRIR
jgi:hypothetical protein